jgi:hypothetical protein
MNRKCFPHIIAIGAFVVFIALGLARQELFGIVILII